MRRVDQEEERWSANTRRQTPARAVRGAYRQVWAGDLLHPGTVLGSFVVVCGTAVSLLACAPCLAGAHSTLGSHTLPLLSALLVVVLAWANLSVIWFAGWEVPALRRP